jgi:hypothetical protein
VAVKPLPVPRSLAGNISGEMAYNTPYIICAVPSISAVTKDDGKDGLTLLQKTYPQFQPRRSLEFLAVVLARRKTPVSPIFPRGR